MDTLAFGYVLPTPGRTPDLHRLETCAAGRTRKNPAQMAGFSSIIEGCRNIYCDSPLAMGMITDSDTFRIMANIPGENPAGDVPIWVATSAMSCFIPRDFTYVR